MLSGGKSVHAGPRMKGEGGALVWYGVGVGVPADTVGEGDAGVVLTGASMAGLRVAGAGLAGTRTGGTAGVAVVAGVAAGVGAGVVAGVAGTPVPARPGEEVTAGEVAAGVAATVAAGVSVGYSVGVGGRGMNGVGTSLAWLAGEGDREGDGEADGVRVRLVGAGPGAEGQRPQVAAQKPPAGAPGMNMKVAPHAPPTSCNGNKQKLTFVSFKLAAMMAPLNTETLTASSTAALNGPALCARP